MKVQVTQEKLSAALQSAGRVAGRNSSLPILANVLLRCSNNRLLVSATNLELAISEKVGAKVEQEGDITVPARLLSEFVQNLPSDTVELFTEDNTLHVKSKNYTSTIYGISSTDFPSIPDISGKPNASVAGNDLREAISQVAGSASGDETRPILTGVTLAIEGKTITLAATDSYRLSERSIPATSVATSEFQQVIIPARSLQELQRLIKDNETVQIFLDEGQIKCVVEERELVSRLIDGSYPDYRQLIPEDNKTQFSISTSELLRITKVASLFAKDSGGSVTLSTDPSKNQIQLKSIAAQVGDNTSVSTVKNIEGEDQVTFNARYLIEALQVFPDIDLEFSFNGKLAPCLIKPVDKKYQYLHIIMPLRS